MAIKIEQERITDHSAVRNSDYREYTTPLDPTVHLIYRFSGGHIKAWHISLLAFVAGIAAIEIEESQHRKEENKLGKTAVAGVLEVISGLGDVIDGKYARLERSFMTDEKERDEHEKKGQTLDPFLDGALEGWRKTSAAITSFLKGDIESAKAAFGSLRKSNLPRTAKAVVGSIGIAVPESYKPWDLRFYGTSSGRRGPDIVATFIHDICGIPVQRYLDNFTANANVLVTLARLATVINCGSYKLSEREIGHARFRLKVLAAESLFFFAAGHLLERLLLANRTEKGSSTP